MTTGEIFRAMNRAKPVSPQFDFIDTVLLVLYAYQSLARAQKEERDPTEAEMLVDLEARQPEFKMIRAAVTKHMERKG